jgi:phenylacetate-coenzyme A ligase PaaK-like adenylate-forming protein
VFVTGGHFAGVAGMQRAQRRYPRLARGARLLSALDPLPVIVDELNSFQPSLLAGYPSVLELLAGEQLDGTLRLRPPALVLTGGEHLAPTARARITAAFDAPVRDTYGASEFPGIAYECRQGWLHLHADWSILEPVTADGRPVPPGELSDTVLLTNLANRAQPLIRYDLGDRVLFAPEACRCGSPLPALRVEGRTNDTVVLVANGREVRLLPLALVTVAEDAPGVRRCQLVQTGPASLRLRLDISPTADADEVWEDTLRRLRAFLAARALPGADIGRAVEPPLVEPRSGKLRQVVRAPFRSSEGAPR